MIIFAAILIAYVSGATPDTAPDLRPPAEVQNVTGAGGETWPQTTPPPKPVKPQPKSGTYRGKAAPDALKIIPFIKDKGEIPPGAPSDDYGFISWCRGALEGHMSLAEGIKSKLLAMRQKDHAAEEEKLDQDQKKAGQDYLNLYAQALKQADVIGGDQLRDYGRKARESGQSIWLEVQKADDDTRLWSWVMWELPPRCETAANRLLANTKMGRLKD